MLTVEKLGLAATVGKLADRNRCVTVGRLEQRSTTNNTMVYTISNAPELAVAWMAVRGRHLLSACPSWTDPARGLSERNGSVQS